MKIYQTPTNTMNEIKKMRMIRNLKLFQNTACFNVLAFFENVLEFADN